MIKRISSIKKISAFFCLAYPTATARRDLVLICQENQEKLIAGQSSIGKEYWWWHSLWYTRFSLLSMQMPAKAWSEFKDSYWIDLSFARVAPTCEGQELIYSLTNISNYSILQLNATFQLILIKITKKFTFKFVRNLCPAQHLKLYIYIFQALLRISFVR